MASNNDLAVAVLRVYRARLEAERVGISTAPDVNASLNSNINRPLSESSARNKTSGATLSTSYEVDSGANWRASATPPSGPASFRAGSADGAPDAAGQRRHELLAHRLPQSADRRQPCEHSLRQTDAAAGQRPLPGRQHLGTGRGERGTERADAGKPAADVATRASTGVERTGGAAGRTFRPDHHRARTFCRRRQCRRSAPAFPPTS